MNIVLIGAGNVAHHLGQALKSNGHRIIQVFSRSKKSSSSLSKILKCASTTSVSKIKPDADIYIVALRDEAISPILEKLEFIPKLIVHTSGSIGLDVFPERMKNSGVLYPVQTFSKSTKKLPEKIPFCIEGKNKKTLITIRKLATSLSTVVFKMNSSERALVHLSAVFANNFSNYLFILSERILKTKKLSFDLLRPLILETAQKVQTYSPKVMQTGPARRGDSTIINKHLKLLKENPDLESVYNLLSKRIEKDFGPLL